MSMDEIAMNDVVSVDVGNAPTEVAADAGASVRLVEAILFASAEPLSFDMLWDQIGREHDLSALLQQLKQEYAERGVNLVETGGYWSFRTAPDLAATMKITRSPRRKLPRAAAEVLAIIAYHQPVTRAEVEQVRGVETSKGTLDILLELGWIRPGKRRETPGRPLTWHTTPDFLSHFNIESLKDLPGMEELKAAGLLDARPVLSSMPKVAEGDDALAGGLPDEDSEYEVWAENQTAAAQAG